MSRYSNNDLTDEKGQDLLSSALPKNLFKLEYFGSNDKTPDIDGILRLRDGQGNYCNQYLHFQLKSSNQADLEYITLKAKDVSFLCETNVPTIIFISDLSKQIAFWYFIDEEVANSRRTQGLRIVLANPISQENIFQIYAQWQNLAKKTDLQVSSNKLKTIAVNHLKELKSILGLLFLLRRGRRGDFSRLATALFNISAAQLSIHLDSLETQEIITTTRNFLLLNDDALGKESASQILNSKSMDTLFTLLNSNDDKSLLLSSIIECKDPWVNPWLQKIARQLTREAHESNRFTEKVHAVSLLRKIAPKITKDALPLIKSFAEIKYLPNRTFKQKIRLNDSKNASDVIVAASQALLNLFMTDQSVLKDVWSIMSNSSNDVKKRIQASFKEIISYDLDIINTYGFTPQQVVMKFLSEIRDLVTAENVNFICNLCSELLNPSYESRRYIDWRTFQFNSEALPATEQLELIRTQVITYLFDVFRSTRDLKIRQRIIGSLGEATLPSHFGKPTPEHMTMVINNANTVIDLFRAELVNMQLREIVFLEEQLENIDRFFGIENIPTLINIKNEISKNAEYQIVQALIGWGYLPTESQQKAHSERISAMFSDLTKNSLSVWKSRLEFLAMDRELLTNKGYVFLLDFIRRIGREKAEIGNKLLTSKNLKLVFPSLLCGIEEAQQTEYIVNWINKNLNKYPEQISEFFRMSASTNFYVYYEKLLKIGEQKRNANILRNLLESLVYKKQVNSKAFALALRLVTSLAKINDRHWASAFSREEYLTSLTISKQQIRLILDALLLAKKLEYHEIVIIRHIGASHPLSIVDFFIRRIEFQCNNNYDWNEYDPIPFNLDGLSEILLKKPLETINKLSPLLINPNFRFGAEVKQIFEKVFTQYENLFSSAITKLLANPTKRSIAIAVRLLRQIREPSLFCKLAETIILTKKLSPKDKDDISYKISRYDPIPDTVKDWESNQNVTLKQCYQSIIKYKVKLEERRREWEIEQKKSEEQSLIKEEEELRKRGLFDQ